MKTPAFQKVSGINPAFLSPSTCSVSLLSHPSRKEGRGGDPLVAVLIFLY